MSKNKKTAKPAGPPAEAPTCPVCSTALQRSGLVLCRKCSTPHHRRCWEFNKGCGTYGCGSRVVVVAPASPTTPTADPRLDFTRQFGYLDDRSGALMAVICMALFFTRPELIAVALAAFLAPSLLGLRHRVLPETGGLERAYMLGRFALWRRPRFRLLAEVDALEVRRRAAGDPPRDTREPYEVWARLRSGREILLEVTPRMTLDALLARLEVPAQEIDTVVALPPGVGEPAALPAGLDATLDALGDDPEL